MPRLRNKVTGVVVSTSAEAAEALGQGWVSVDPQPAKEASKPAPRRRTKKAE